MNDVRKIKLDPALLKSKVFVKFIYPVIVKPDDQDSNGSLKNERT